MPNICDFNMRVLGRAQDVDFFVEELNQDYCYDENGMCKEVSGNKRHFCRVFEAHTTNLNYNSVDIGNGVFVELKEVEILGNCAWSVAGCMCGGPYSYYSQLREKYGNRSRATTLAFETSRLNLIVELYSEESGCGFSEHMLYVDGVEKVSECVEYYERCYDEEDEELDEPIVEGGFGDWDYTEDYDKELAQVIYSKYGRKCARTFEKYEDYEEYEKCGE